MLKKPIGPAGADRRANHGIVNGPVQGCHRKGPKRDPGFSAAA
jgi:hypothetical protein